MDVDISVTHTLSEIQRAILTASSLMGPAYANDLVVAVQLSDLAKLDYSNLLKQAIWRRAVVVGWSIFKGQTYHRAFSDLEKTSKFSNQQIHANVTLLTQLELLEPEEKLSYVSIWSKVRLTGEGERLAEAIARGRVLQVRPPKSDQGNVFFAGAFDHEDVDLLFANEIEPACAELGYAAYRVDAREPFQGITSAILSGVRDAACVIADLTYARPSVYFEAGFAHGLGIGLLLTCRNDHFRGADDRLRVHFDLEQYKTSFWSATETGFSWPKLMHPLERLRTIVGQRPKPGGAR